MHESRAMAHAPNVADVKRIALIGAQRHTVAHNFAVVQCRQRISHGNSANYVVAMLRILRCRARNQCQIA